MDAIRKWLLQTWARLGSAGARSHALALLLVAMVVTGGVLLLASGGDDDFVAVRPDEFEADELAAVRSVLSKRGISYQIESGRLLVARQDVQRVRDILAGEGPLAGDGATAFEKLAEGDDIWQTHAQSARRWQAAKMRELGKLISGFPSVQRATVILEMGTVRKLGSPPVPPTAAVHVTMKGAPLTGNLAQAIADLVSGSVSGMKSQDVRIVDSSGRSFRVAQDGSVTCPQAPAGGAGEALAAPGPAPRQPSSPPGTVHQPAARGTGADFRRVAAATMVLAGLVGGAGWLLWRRRRPVAGKPAAADEEELPGLAEEIGDLPEHQAPQRVGEPPSPGGAFGFLRSVLPDEVAGLLEMEHPQTLAIILPNLPPQQAAAVLSALPPDKQIEVARRVGDLGQTDQAVVAEIEQALASRLAEAGRRPVACGGSTTIAEILHHAGYAAEKVVLDAMETQRPALADRIRRKLLAFEDLAQVPEGSLRDALEGFDGPELAVALRTAGKVLKRQILSCLPPEVARQVRREMDQIGPVRLSDVESAQQRIVDAVRRLAEARHAEAAEAEPFIA